MIDSHTHVSGREFDEDRAEVLSRAFGICDLLIDVGCGAEDDAFERARKLAEEYDKVYFTAGVHPHDAQTIGFDEQKRNEILCLMSHPKCVALGECGLDYYYDNSPREAQREVFQWHIDQAPALDQILMIHTRDAEEDTQKLLAPYTGRAIFHCFTGTKELALFGVEKGFFISFSGIATFKKAENVREAFMSVPLENILIETDAPFLAPLPKRGKRNEPAFLQYTAEYLASLRGLPLDEFKQITTANARRAFCL